MFRSEPKKVPKQSLMMHQERMDESLQDYLAVLASSYPFTLEITAEPSRLSQELAAHMPAMRGWEQRANNFWDRVEELANPFLERGRQKHVRLTINAGAMPRVPHLTPDAPVVYAAFDASEGIEHHALLLSDKETLASNAALNHVDLGVVVVCQPSQSQGDARAVAIGTPSIAFSPFMDKLSSLVERAQHEERLQNVVDLTQARHTLIPSKPIAQTEVPNTPRAFNSQAIHVQEALNSKKK